MGLAHGVAAGVDQHGDVARHGRRHDEGHGLVVEQVAYGVGAVHDEQVQDGGGGEAGRSQTRARTSGGDSMNTRSAPLWVCGNPKLILVRRSVRQPVLVSQQFPMWAPAIY